MAKSDTAKEQPQYETRSLLEKLTAIADEIYEKWDNDQRSGKLLRALAGFVPRYRADVTEIRNYLAGWQPIDTAPKDGTEVLVWWPAYELDDDSNLTNIEVPDAGARVVAQFDGGAWQSGDQLEGVGDFFGDDHEYGHEPTLWAPIPPKPVRIAPAKAEAAQARAEA